MDAKELLKRVRRIEIKTRGLSSQLLSGEYHSHFKGRGMAFSEVREYASGDEIRTIDWNVTARLGETHVKVFEEERELTTMILVDMSASMSFGTHDQYKLEMMTEIAAVLAFSAIQNKDKCGMILFTNKVHKFIPPKKGKSHILRMIRELVDFDEDTGETNVGEALQYFTRTVKKRSIAFVLSDFIDNGFEDPLRIANTKHDLVGIQIKDRREYELPNIGWVEFFNPETKIKEWINTSSKKVREKYSKSAENFQSELDNYFRKAGIDYCTVETGEDYVKSLINLFKRR